MNTAVLKVADRLQKNEGTQPKPRDFRFDQMPSEWTIINPPTLNLQTVLTLLWHGESRVVESL